MKILNLAFFACLFCAGIVSCAYAQKQQEKTKEFRLPDVPVTLTAPEDRAAYLSLHYWDHFDFADTSLISRPEITEQAFVDFISILPHTPKAQESVDTLFRRTLVDREMLYHFISLGDSTCTNPILPCTTRICISSFCVPWSIIPDWKRRTGYVPVTCWKWR